MKKTVRISFEGKTYDVEVEVLDSAAAAAPAAAPVAAAPAAIFPPAVLPPAGTSSPPPAAPHSPPLSVLLLYSMTARPAV